LRFDYLNTYTKSGKALGSVADADIADLDIGPDWTLSGIKALRLAFRGQAGNAVSTDDKMWVQLEDTSSNSGIVIYNGDPCDVAEEEWQEWHIDLADFNSAGVVLTSVDRVHIGFGGYYQTGAKTGGSGTVWFDDIELWPPYCRTELIATDFTGDCVTDGLDLAVMAADWLLSDGLVVSGPPADAPAVWYRFDEGAGSTVRNDGDLGSSYNGIIPGAPNTPTWDSDGAPAIDSCDPNYSMNFDGSDYVEIPVLNLNTNTATISAWVKRAGDQPNWAGIVFCRGPNTTSGIGFRDGLKTSHNLSYHWDGWFWWYDAGLEVPDGQWTFTSLVVEPEQATLYMSDGTDWDSATNVDYHTPDEFDANTYVGEDPQGGRMMIGKVDDVRIYDRSLKVGEVLGLAGVSTSFYDPLEEPTNLVVRVPDPAVDPNYYPSNPDIINFGDYDAFANKWLEGPTLWP
ncbi:MAG: LamG domain-containing protein, partial [Planctomycetota bacterium]